MRTIWMRLFVLTALSITSCLVLAAQEVIHAVAGTVTSTDTTTKSIVVQGSDGARNVFSYARPRVKINLDKPIRSEAVEPSVYNKVGDHVVVYFYGENDQQTVVAIKDLGKAPLNISTGTVIDENRRHHTFTIKTAAGASETYQIANDTSIDTPEGVIDGIRFDPMRNSRVIVKYRGTTENRVAQFIREDY